MRGFGFSKVVVLVLTGLRLSNVFGFCTVSGV